MNAKAPSPNQLGLPFDTHRLRGGMVGMGMIFDETYRPCFESAFANGVYDRRFGVCEVELAAVASRTGKRAEAYKEASRGKIGDFASFKEPNSIGQLLETGVDFVCVATPDNRHFEAAEQALKAGKHVLIEKPSVLSLAELDALDKLAREKNVLAKIVYHKLYDPDHKKLRTLVHEGTLKHVNSGYCTLLEPKQISGAQFAEWITGRNPGTYVAVHYIKLIDFSFGGRLKSVSCTGQRGIVGPKDGPTWDSTQLLLRIRIFWLA
jgi:predicted dehydrogenase